jgi:hypothetical protein
MADELHDPSLPQRIARLEALYEIERLSHRYTWCADTRDLESLLELFVPDVDCGRFGVGRDALRDSYNIVHRQFYRTVHQVTGVLIDLVDDDHATGKIQMRAEHEVGERWVVALMTMMDTYERRDGRWYFVRRKPERWYSSEILDRPSGPDFTEPMGAAERPSRLPHLQETWATFWAGHEEDVARLTRHP